jgi:hypothetical protein
MAAPVQKAINAFNAGELSPRMDARRRQEKYDFGCRQLKNYVLYPQGGATSRFGLEYIAPAKLNDKQARVLPFSFSKTTNFILEAGDNYMRFYSNGAQVVDPAPVEVATPWLEADLDEIQFKEINDLMYFTHPDHPVQKLTRLSDTNWTLEEVDWDHPPVLDQNITNTTVQVDVATGSGTLTSSAPLFNAQHVGAYWQVSQTRPGSSTQKGLLSSGTSSAITVVPGQSWNLVTSGRWDGTVRVEAEDPGVPGVWEVIREFVSVNASLNVDTGDTEDAKTNLRISFTLNAVPTAGAEDPQAVLSADSVINKGIVKITAFGTSQSVSVDVKKEIQSPGVATSRWSEGAFSEFRGHPRSLEIHEERFMLGGTSSQARRVWGSRTGRYEDFELGTDDDHALAFDLNGTAQNQINWLVSEQQLMVGTAGAEHTVGSRDPDKALTPAFTPQKRQSTYGSKFLQAQIVNDVVLFAQRLGRKIREAVYSFERDKNVAPDMTILAEHITEGGIKQTAYSQQPDQIFWFVTNDGQLIGMTYEREQDVIGFHRHETQGRFESVAVIPGTERDEIWCVVARDLPSGTVRYVERIRPFKWQKVEEFFFVDSGLSYPESTVFTSGNAEPGKRYRVQDEPTGTMDLSNVGGPAFATKGNEFLAVQDPLQTAPANEPNDFGGGSLREVFTSFGNLGHLEGMTVQCLIDGAPIVDQVVTGGQITIPDGETGYSASIGLGFSNRLQPMRLDVANQMGEYPAREMRVKEVVARVEDTIGMVAGISEDELYDRPFRSTAMKMDQVPDLLNGDYEVDIHGRYDFKGDIILGQDQCLPSTILSLTAKYEVTGRP